MRTLTEIHFVSGEKLIVAEALEVVQSAVAVQSTRPFTFTRPGEGLVRGGLVHVNGAHIAYVTAIED